jgi:hypothetical protein
MEMSTKEVGGYSSDCRSGVEGPDIQSRLAAAAFGDGFQFIGRNQSQFGSGDGAVDGIKMHLDRFDAGQMIEIGGQFIVGNITGRTVNKGGLDQDMRQGSLYCIRRP